jgi:hypothetical protein
MDERDRDKIIHRVVRRIADDFGCTVAEVNALLDRHPIEVDRDKYLKRVLALQLLQLDELEEAFHDKAIVDRDVPSGVLLIKAQERRATLLGLNPPIGHAVRVVQHPSANQPTSTDKIERALNALIADGKRSQSGRGEPH